MDGMVGTGLRRFGPLCLWSSAVVVAMYPNLLLIVWLDDSGSEMMRWWSRGLIYLEVAALFLAFVSRKRLADGLSETAGSGRRWPGIEPSFEVIVVLQPLVCLLATMQSLDLVRSNGLGAGTISYLAMWAVFQLLPWTLFFKNRTPKPLPPRPGASGSDSLRLWHVSDREDDSDRVEVAVRVEEPLSIAEVLGTALRYQVLPAVPGGTRRWTVLVDGAPMGELTQTWQHPRWWREIEWADEVSPSALFKGERIEFRAAPAGQQRRRTASTTGR
ncbi:hypothetical protein SAMN05216298_0188 [Glycomyces sambucus]|uniref:Uncharacterized protein n=1 Tax=Glycomyces sambucus TaxID=380244 RepID=A0A1G9NAD8_9ACTN|nr:hypothetical protein [Glycomyces sambucus]SDL83434.1 hypothetical protein SAMN05216298_0188 [Glycomyces sambucus]